MVENMETKKHLRKYPKLAKIAKKNIYIPIFTSSESSIFYSIFC